MDTWRTLNKSGGLMSTINQRSYILTLCSTIFISIPLYRKHHLLRWLKTTAGYVLHGKGMPGSSLWKEVRVLGKEIPWSAAMGTWKKMQSNQKIAQTQIPHQQEQSKRDRMWNSSPKSHLPDWLNSASHLWEPTMQALYKHYIQH